MRRARAFGSRPHASRCAEAHVAALLDDPCFFLLSDGPLRHPRAILLNAFPADAVRVLRPKVP